MPRKAAQRGRRQRAPVVDGVRYQRAARYFVTIPGLRALSLEYCTFDGTVLGLEQRPGGYVSLVMRQGGGRMSFTTAVFYANCLAYDHDSPTYPAAQRHRALDKPLLGAARDEDWYEWFEETMGMLFERRIARRGEVALYFRGSPSGTTVFDLPYTARFGAQSERLAMYASALRQIDPLSEFLNYYRVLENREQHNGKATIERLLPSLAGRDFGRLPALLTVRSPTTKHRAVNLLAAYRQRAVSRAGVLMRRFGSAKGVADYLWAAVRCGIAHGKAALRMSDFGNDVHETARDVPLIKMLARAAIDESIPLTTVRQAKDDGWERMLDDAQRYRANDKEHGDLAPVWWTG